MVSHPHGPCQCGDDNAHGPKGCLGPAAYAVIRDGRLARVCTTCFGATDRLIRILPQPHELDVYQAWDATTARTLERKITRHLKVN